MKASLITISIIALIGWGILLLGISENTSSSFDNFAEVEKAGLITNSWLPNYLPSSSTQIQEHHDIDTNQVWAVFKYSVQDTKKVESNCTKVAESKNGIKFLCPPFDTRTSTIILNSNGEGYYLSYENGI